MDSMSMLASVLLILFTLEIIFIFIYMPSTVQYMDDTDKSGKPDSVGPPQFPPPVPPIYTNVGDYEFDGEFGGPGRGPGRRPGRHPRRPDDSDSDSDSDDDGNQKKKKLTIIHFFIVKNMKTDKRESDVTIKPKFDHNNPKQKYELTIDKNIEPNNLLIANYHNIHAKVHYKILGDDKIIQKGKGTGGTIKIGKIKDLKQYTTLQFTINEK